MSLLHLISDEPAGLFSGPFREETEKGLGGRHGIGSPEIFVAMDLTLPGGTKKYSNVGLVSTVHGQYDARVESFGMIPREVSENSNNLSDSVEMSVVISDTDREFAREVATHKGNIRGSAVTIRLHSPNVSDDDAFTAFVGVLDGYSQPEPMKWEIRLRPDDWPLRRVKVPRTSITLADWPAAASNAQGQYLGPVYGVHDSNGSGEFGAIPALLIDKAAFKYAWMLGAGSVQAAYADGIVVSEAEWTASTETKNGKLWSVVTFDADQGDAEITLDVEGITTEPDGSGTLITNPVEQIKHFIVNFVWNDWRSGAYYEESTAPLSTVYLNLTADFLSALGHEGSKRFAGEEPEAAIDKLNEWLDSHEIKAFWRNNGQLAIRPIADHRTQRLYFNTQVLKGSELAESFARLFDTTNVVQKVSGQYIYNEAAGKFLQVLEVSDLSVADDVTVTRTLPWSADRIL